MKIWGPPHNTRKLNAIYHPICSRPGKKKCGCFGIFNCLNICNILEKRYVTGEKVINIIKYV
jgi:hypothetical protein